jgi:hypothetical protein
MGELSITAAGRRSQGGARMSIGRSHGADEVVEGCTDAFARVGVRNAPFRQYDGTLES